LQESSAIFNIGCAVAAAVALSAFTLGGCGVRGPLKLPPGSAPAAVTPPPAEAPAEAPAQPDVRKP